MSRSQARFNHPQFNRRQFLRSTLFAGASVVTASLGTQRSGLSAPAVIPSERSRPQIPYGVMSGDVGGSRAVVWSRADRLSRMRVELSLEPDFRRSRLVYGEVAQASQDFTSRVVLSQLPTDRPIFYRVQFQDLDQPKILSEPAIGQLQIPNSRRDIFFAWGGDTAGQGWGINPEFGGMKIYETMRQLKPDFFIHSGDTIYADNPIQAEVKLEDGRIWKNLTTPEKSKVAETLQEFRGNFIYNLLDENVRRFNAEVPVLMQWDDHEVVNNWYPTEILDDSRYTVKNVAVLAQRAKQAFLEYSPLRSEFVRQQKIERSFFYGKHLEIFMLDMRSYRGANNPNRQTVMGPDTAFLGNQQIQWLKQRLKQSRATWKVIAADMPLGLVVADGKTDFENLANGAGPALGRELELADLLKFIKQQNIRNTVWLTADVHYAAAHYYDPDRAQFQDFHGFWEFVAGPLNAGNFGPNPLDNTFGPQVKFQTAAPTVQINQPPSQGQQFFGTVKIAQDSGLMTVTLRNLWGETLFSIDLPPA
ncbi:alkaline phosphatase D family protein [Alkalinema sp. FACHB-956]|uniref:alkaline phosphatase D family protein n=1 Tax=Alkalinema sp. FACHB-956 TaxID=2692768 RepID=UPI0016831F6A|nr:alkaline phosphatase D family protein [Alkalinema sp. FACHB-956]MBD2326260.1 alkaline phosphatase D family protein [Alkalinema sp. FACHB-956]